MHASMTNCMLTLDSLVNPVLDQAASKTEVAKKQAITWEDGSGMKTLTYLQLYETVRDLSREFAKFIKADDIVGIYMKAVFELPIILLSVLSRPATFFPLDTNKANAIEQFEILSETGAEWILVEEYEWQSLLQSAQFAKLSGWSINLIKILECSFLLVKLPQELRPPYFVEGGIQPGWSRLAYVIQSSGTTGKPKIIKVPHMCIVPNIESFRKIFKMQSHDVIFLSSPLTFDPSIVQIFLALSSGATLLMTHDDVKMQPSQLCKVLFTKQKTTILQVTPSLLHLIGGTLLGRTVFQKGSSLRLLALGGETFPDPKLLSSWIGNNTSIKIFNLYGTTEVSSWATCCKVDLESFVKSPTIKIDSSIKQSSILNSHDIGVCISAVPIGEPLEDTRVEVHDNDGKDITDGVGEIWIGGEKRVCLLDSEQEYTPGTMRSTGDLGLKRDGKIYFICRRDSRIKRFGKVIDLENIERIAQSVTGVSAASCVFKEQNNTNFTFSRVVLYVVTQDKSCDKDEFERKIRQTLSKQVLSHNTPDKVVFLPSMPITSHGKSDKQALKVRDDDTEAFDFDLSLEEFVKHAWKLCLMNFRGSSSLKSDNENFISDGGDSVAAVYFANIIDKYLFYKYDEKFETSLLLNTILTKPITDLLCYLKLVTEKKNTSSVELNPPVSPITTEIPVSPLSKKDRKRKGYDIAVNKISTPKRSNLHNEYSCFCSFTRGNKKVRCITCRNNTDLLQEGMIGPYITSFKDLDVHIQWRVNLSQCNDASPLISCSGYTNDPSPVVYIGSHSHIFVAICLETGEVLWETTLGDRIESSATLSRDGKHVVVGCYDGFLYVLDRSTGDIVWKYATGESIKSSPLLDPETGIIYFGSHDHHLYAVDIEKKCLHWKYDADGSSCFSSPAMSARTKTLFIGTLGGKLIQLDPDTGLERWKFNCGKPIFSSPATRDEIVATGCVDGCLYCLELEGTLKWRFQTNGPIFSTPVFVDDFAGSAENSAILIGSHDCTVYLLDLIGNPLWMFQAGSPVYSTPTTMKFDAKANTDIDGTTISISVVCSTNGFIYLINAATGTSIKRLKLKGEIFSSPVRFENKIVVGCRDNDVYCLELKMS